MSILDNLNNLGKKAQEYAGVAVDKARDLAEVAADKAKNATDTAKLNMAILTEQRELEKNYRAIGEWFISEYTGEIPDAVKDVVAAVNASKARIAEIKNTISVTTSDYDKEKLQERLAKLSGGVAVIKVGAQTEVAMKEQKLRVEDALNATRAAVEEGIVAGGGTAYVNAVPAVEKLIGKVEGDEKTGVKIIVNALQEPVRQIAKNAGVDGSVVLEKIKSSRKVGYGFDAYKEVYCDMIGAGIVDPAKVTRSALENAASVSSMVLTTEALVADKPEPPAPAAPAGMGGMDGMY